MSTELNKAYQDLHASYTKTIENIGIDRINKARDKAFAKDRFLSQVQNILMAYSRGFSKHTEASNYFSSQFRSGDSIEDITDKIVKDYPEALKITVVVEGRDTAEFIEFSDNETVLLKKFPAKIQQLIGFFIGYSVFSKLYEKIPSYNIEDKSSNKTITTYPLEWTGEKGNKNEFVQLVYGLYKAGLINNGKGEITKIVETLAEVFSLELGNNWQSNLSASIHNSKSGSNPPVFGKLRLAFEKYAKDLVEHKKKNS